MSHLNHSPSSLDFFLFFSLVLSPKYASLDTILQFFPYSFFLLKKDQSSDLQTLRLICYFILRPLNSRKLSAGSQTGSDSSLTPSLRLQAVKYSFVGRQIMSGCLFMLLAPVNIHASFSSLDFTKW